MTEDDDELFDALSADDDAYVSALLADLPDVPMPDVVRARIDVALADLAAVPTPAGATTVLPGGVVPITAARSRWRNPRILQAAAAVVLVVAAVAVGIKSTSTHDTSASEAGSGAAMSSRSAATASGTAYTTDTLAAGIRRLVAQSGVTATNGGLSADKSGGTSAPQAPSPATAGGGLLTAAASPPSDAHTLAFSVAALAACISVIEDSATYTQPIAIDSATYNGQSALLVVLPNPDDTTTYGVWIVAPACGQGGDAHLISYAAIPRT